MTAHSCIFCAIVAGEAPAYRLYDDERTLAFLDINPWGAGHTLVVPKTHAQDLFDVADEDLDAVMTTVRHLAPRLRDAVGAAGLALAQLNGADAGQSVFHLHVHLIPRLPGEGLPAGPRPSAYDLAELHAEIRAAL
jgi:histidine triad (HIT) family protein